MFTSENNYEISSEKVAHSLSALRWVTFSNWHLWIKFSTDYCLIAVYNTLQNSLLKNRHNVYVLVKENVYNMASSPSLMSTCIISTVNITETRNTAMVWTRGAQRYFKNLVNILTMFYFDLSFLLCRAINLAKTHWVLYMHTCIYIIYIWTTLTPKQQGHRVKHE